LNESFLPQKKSRRSEPRGRISDLSTTSPTLQHDGLDEKQQGISASPPFPEQKCRLHEQLLKSFEKQPWHEKRKTAWIML
jgi:hypothetical protein